MNVSDGKQKPSPVSVKPNKPERHADELQKIVSLSYLAFAAFVDACENQEMRIERLPVAGTARRLLSHLDRAIITADLTQSETGSIAGLPATAIS